ncbi:PREDICTED: protein yellow [Rhagoletis zephyria]|uniref:protein yellow n=1 Tax=Rhagoletis zephyria TaxID=28612 RepID=UPI000811305B|nr:PREDICTED: protein yellow [Rhagoletis zephyria]
MWLIYCCLAQLLTGMTIAGVAENDGRPVLQRKEFVTLHKWTELKLTVPESYQQPSTLDAIRFAQDKLLPVDVDVEYGDDGYHRTFLTIPRLSNGVLYSLTVVADSDNSTVLNPFLVPYPSYDWHLSFGQNCSTITSAIRTFIDDCWRLWVVDLGQINGIQYCAPQILAFDLVTDQLIHRYIIPASQYTPGVSIFTALAVDVDESAPSLECVNAMVYIADPWGYGLIVYNMAQGQSWRIQNTHMQPDQLLTQDKTGSSGIFTVSISPRQHNKEEADRRLYFHALNSFLEVSVPLSLVNNASLWTLPSNSEKQDELYDQFKIIGSRGIQCESEAMDNDGNLYCSLISSSALTAWKEDSDYDSDNLKVVAYNPERLRFVTGLKINRNNLEEDELWALSSNPELFVGAKVQTDDIKFQIIGCRVKNLLENEPCSVVINHLRRA